jgi:DNA-binding NtrC family response regulator
MAFARLVVVHGPDIGTVYPIPMRGGGIGRGEGNLVQLQDPSVSREHCTIELHSGQLRLVSQGSRNPTLVNGAPVETHILSGGDEISIGHSRLAFHQEDIAPQDPAAQRPSRVTIEVGSSALLLAQVGAPDGQRRHLAALAAFGDSLHNATNTAELGRAACQAIVAALKADRGFLLLRDKGRMVPAAACVVPSDPAGQQLSVPADLIAKVTAEGKCVVAEGVQTSSGPRPAVAAPLLAAPDQGPRGLLYADRLEGSWQEIDLMAMSCLGHLLSAALANLEARTSLVQENQNLNEQLGKGGFVGESPAAQTLLGFVAKVGPSDASVLITGQSGSGKEMVARGIHQASRRTGKPFVAVNCAALTESLIESELFGHEKGAFTGATDRKIGRFEAANHGTLFLDEVGELPLRCQTKFLRVLEEQCFERVGGTKSIHVNVRVVAATNRDLPAMVKQGTFREDLYYRLSVIHTMVPSLGERPTDIPILAHHFLLRLRSQVARQIDGFTRDAMHAMSTYSWPGNVRELRNAVERAIVLGDGTLLEAADLPPELFLGAAAVATPPIVAATAPIAPSPAAEAGAPMALRDLEKNGIIAALQSTGGNKARAAALLQIDRSTLYKKIKDYEIES